jgi:serine/threonine protein kinase
MSTYTSVESIFVGALQRQTPDDRAAYLAAACGDDADLRGQVERLLAAHPRAVNFLEQPAAAAFAATGTLTPDQPATGDEPPADPLGEQPGDSVGLYKLLQKLGEGGMGAVWVAEQQQPVRRRVALKLIKPGMDSRQVITRFEQERQALALMDHTHIAKVLDAGTTPQGRPYFVMELVKGVPITKYCDELHLSIRERLELFVPVCQAVQHAHQKGVIHRDLKPSNVLVAIQDGKPVPKIIDFGVAKALHTKLAERTLYTEIGAVIGTLEYMAPEQAELSALDIDTRADVYALGVLLYELLTGSTPLDRQRLRTAALDEVFRLIREEEPPKPSTRLTQSTESLTTLAAKRRADPRRLGAEVRGDLDWIVMKALEKDRTRRYETANGFARDVQRYLTDEAIEARPPSARYRLRKFVRRNRVAVFLTTLSAAAVAAVLFNHTIGLYQIRRERDRALAAEQVAQAERDRAEAARALADRNFQKARTAVEDYLQKVADNPELKNNPNSHGLRKQLLTAALPFFEEFVQQKSDDPAVRFDQGQAYARLARVRGDVGEREAAIRDYTSARNIYTTLAAEFPAVPEYRFQLASSHDGLGHLFSGLRLSDFGKRAEAETAFRQALAILEKLAADFPAVPVYRSNVAVSHCNLGDLLRDLGKRDEAEAAYRQALAIQEKVVADFPAERRYRLSLAYHHASLGILLEGVGKPGEAEVAYRQALAIREKLVADFPAILDYRESLAGSAFALGNVLNVMGKRAEAEAAYRQALAVREKLAADFPAVRVYRQDLAFSHTNLGLLLRILGKRAEAEAHDRQALAVKEKLAADFPTVPAYRVSLAGSYVNFGITLRDRGEPAAALDWFANAIPLLEAVLAQDSRVAIARQYLRNAHWMRAVALRRLARSAEAVEDIDRALALDDGSARSNLRLDRAAALAAQTGDHATAIAEADEMTRGDKVSASTLYDAARVYALSSAAVKDETPRQESYATQAVALLRRARAAGYFQGGSHVEQLKTDPDLAALRGRADFQALVKDLEASKTPSPQ